MNQSKQPLKIIFEDENILVINKPSGLVVHPYDNSTEETLLDILNTSHPLCFSFTNTKVLQSGKEINLGGIVHKLDRETSGVMVLAKNKDTFDTLSQQFKNHEIEKIYLAIVEGIVEKDTYTIDAPLGRIKKSYKQTANPENRRAKVFDAITHIKVLTREADHTLVELTPQTGRTHQLRAHMSYIGHPIIGDIAYGSTISSSRIMLHALSISYTHNNSKVKHISEKPEGFC
jgi:23S rRNA pseudouridine1911/1915/1917 synthase